MTIKQTITNIAITIITIDVLSFIAWQVSGQTPTSSVYFGCITNYIINLI